MTEWIWHILAPTVTIGVIMAASTFALGQAQSGSNSEFQRAEFMLADTQYQILIPTGSRLDDTKKPGCVGIWHPLSTRAMTFLELCSASRNNPTSFARQMTLKNGAHVRYNIDQNIGGGSGGTEGELNGELELGGKVFGLTCRDQGEWGNSPDWCLLYLHRLEVK
jgi:hypothetical protein